MKKLFFFLLSVSILLNTAYGQIISQYIETDSGTSPKGIEIWNNTGTALDFSSNPLVIEKGTNGGTPSADFTLSDGSLASGDVIVIGTSDLQTVTENNGSVFHVKAFTFNGDDALVVKYGGVTTDVFGTSGIDPGSAWTGNGVSTANQNIKLIADITSGDTDGWSDPSERFETVSTTPSSDQSGFGVAPVLSSNAPDDPTSFAATAASSSQVDLSWSQNGNTDNVMIVYDTDGTFTDPVDGTSYSVSSSALGGTVIYNQNGTSFSHTSLTGGTQYYYKAWSVDGSNNYSAGIEDNATTIKAEPTNHPASLTATSSHNSITLTWSDNDGAVVADGILIKASATSIEDIAPAVDGTAEADDTDLSDGSAVVNLSHGAETYGFTGLDAETTYYFTIWAYTNSGTNIDYKTTRPLVSTSEATDAAPSYILDLDFETAGGYTTSTTEFVSNTTDYFSRTDGSNIAGSFSNIQGSYYFAAQDIDAGATLPVTLTIDDVDISGATDLSFSILLAEDDAGDSAEDWDAADYVHIDYDIDNSGSFSNLIHVEATDGTNTAPAIDTNFDGTGNGTTLTDSFTEFTSSIEGTGSLIDIKITFNLNSGDEDIAIDNIRITGSGGTASVDDPTSFTATTASASQINLTWSQNGNSDDVLIVYDADGTFTDPVDGTSYTVSSSALGGTVIYKGNGTSFNHTSLSSANQYYYKAWSVDGDNNYSNGVTDDATTLKAEPSNHASSFSSTSDHNSIDVTWSDNDGSVIADGFLVKASSTSLEAIGTPSDGSAESDDSDLSDGSAVVNVIHGTETCEFSGLDAETTYYFKIWPYTNSGSDIDYKTAGTIPSQSKATTEAPAAPIIFISEVSDPGDVANAKFVELYNAGGSSLDLSAGSWYIARQANGDTWADIALTGTIAAGSTYVIAYNQGDFETAFTPITADQYHGSISGNGDDGYFLYSGGNHSSGTLVDAYGVIDQDGSGFDWEYLDAVAARNSNIGEPNTTWTSSEWTITDPGNVADCTPGTHTYSPPAVDSPIAFSATAASASQINLSWTKNTSGNNVLIVYDTDGSFTNPVDGTSYTVSSSALGGTVIYNGSGTSFSHTGLDGGTQYYYKAWSVDGSDNYSNGMTDDESTVKGEPSNHVSSFAASATHASVTLSWSDNDGAIPADSYLIKADTSSFDNILDPSDAAVVPDDTNLSDGNGAINVAHGVQTYTFSGLDASSTYYFKIYPYTNSGLNIDYQTTRVVPSVSISTSAPVKIMITEIMINPDAVEDVNGEWFEIYNAGTETVNIDGWTISDDGSDSHTIDNGGTLNIASGEYLVLGIDTSTATNGNYSCDYQYSNFSLANGGDEIIISDGITQIDRVAYDDGTNWPIPVGAAIVFSGTYEDDNDDYTRWSAASERSSGFIGTEGDKGSPGASRIYTGILNILLFLEGSLNN